MLYFLWIMVRIMKKFLNNFKFGACILLVSLLGILVSIKDVKAAGEPFYILCNDGSITVTVPYGNGFEVRCNGYNWRVDNQNYLLNPNEKLEIRFAEGTKSSVSRDDIVIGADGETGTVSLGGDILTLLKSDGEVDELPDDCFKDLFEDNKYIVDASNLVVRKVGNNSCANMFKGCTSLTKAPQLPAKTLEACCYHSMFEGCGSLTETPQLPATTLADGCYDYMFTNCASITKAPILPAKTLAKECYSYMFQGCVALTEVPQISATNLAESCCASMFYLCVSLEELHVSFLSLKDVSAPLSNWLEGAGLTAQSCTFYCPQPLIDEANANGGIKLYLGIPDNWNVVAEDPTPGPNPKPNPKPVSGLESTDEDINFMAYLMKLLREDDAKKKAPAKVEIDRDTFKSEAPNHTVIASETATDAFGLFDLKVHKADEKSTTNQEFLAKTLVGPNVQILLTQNIYPRRDLSTVENGVLKKLTWNNLPQDQAGTVFAVIYNETDGAYVINGTLDANGTAVFDGFKLRSASTITICK